MQNLLNETWERARIDLTIKHLTDAGFEQTLIQHDGIRIGKGELPSQSVSTMHLRSLDGVAGCVCSHARQPAMR